MHRSTWKKGEAKIAEMFGTRRTPLSGGNSGHTRSDTLHLDLFIEVKHRKKYPLEKLLFKTFNEANKEDKIPLMVFLKLHSPEPLILCKLKDLKEISEKMTSNDTNANNKEKRYLRICRNPTAREPFGSTELIEIKNKSKEVNK